MDSWSEFWRFVQSCIAIIVFEIMLGVFLYYITLDNDHVVDEEAEEESLVEPVLNDQIGGQETEFVPLQQDCKEEEVNESFLDQYKNKVKEGTVTNGQRNNEDENVKLGKSNENYEDIKLPMKDKEIGDKLEVECVLEQYKTEEKKKTDFVQQEQEDEGTDNVYEGESNTRDNMKPSPKSLTVKQNEDAEWNDQIFNNDIELNYLSDDESGKKSNEIESFFNHVYKHKQMYTLEPTMQGQFIENLLEKFTDEEEEIISYELGNTTVEEINTFTPVRNESTIQDKIHVLTTLEKENKKDVEIVLLEPNIEEDRPLKLFEHTDKDKDVEASGYVLQDLQEDDALENNILRNRKELEEEGKEVKCLVEGHTCDEQRSVVPVFTRNRRRRRQKMLN